MSRQELDATSQVDGYELNSGRGRRKATISRYRRLAASLGGSFTAVVVLLACVGVAASQAEPMPNGVPGTWALILNEEFKAKGLNTALWTPEWTQGAMSGQCTSPSLVSQPGNGYLYLQVRAQESTCSGIKNADTGSLVESNPADGKPGHTGFLYSYGYVEWHAYIVGWGGTGCPKGGCIPDWPALWSFPENEENEIDTMEGLHGTACHTWHHHVSPIEETQGCQSSGTSYAGWHTYGVDWEPGVLKFYYDGTQVGEVNTGYINSTPQYLIMNDVPPGSYGGHLVVPDEIVVEYVRVWKHPPPSETTEPATGVATPNATLNGSVNPNGYGTEYFFQYGPTTEYGYTTPVGNAGAGTSAVPVSASIAGLAPGTTYYYRIVARNVNGETFGGPVAFMTQPPPSVSTSTASELQEVEATLNGTVNGNGLNTKDRFEYGETTAYGSVTSWEEDGSGASNRNTTIVNLQPGHTYHYRIVATSSAGTSYGGDQVVTTLPEFGASNWTVRTPSPEPNGWQWTFYRGVGGKLTTTYYTGTGWGSKVIGNEVAAGTTPTALRQPITNPNGDIWVYYQGANGLLTETYYTESGGWTTQSLGVPMAAGTSPSAVREPTIEPNAWQYVFYQDSSNQLHEVYYTGTGWGNQSLGGPMTAGTSPSVVRLPTDNPNGWQWAFYDGSDGTLHETYYAETGWATVGLGVQMLWF